MDLSHYKEINKDFSRQENKNEKEIFERLILDEINNYIPPAGAYKQEQTNKQTNKLNHSALKCRGLFYEGMKVQVLGSSKHVPLSVDAMRDTMSILFELLEQETEASVREVLGHFIFVFIHPYYGWQLANESLFNEYHAGFQWICFDCDTRRKKNRIHTGS